MCAAAVGIGDRGGPRRHAHWAVFSWSYHTLSPSAARLFRLLGLHWGPDLSVPAAASLTGIPIPKARSLLFELTQAHLLTESTPGRYTFHDLLRAYAAEQAHQVDVDVDRYAATHRLLDHYLHTAHAAARLLYPGRDPIAVPLIPPQPGVTPETPADHGQAMAWFTAEHRVMLAAVGHAAATGWDIHTWQLAWALITFLDRRGHWHDWAVTLHAAVAAARRLADPAAQAYAILNLARAAIRRRRLYEARTQLWHALDLFRQTGDHVGQARTHIQLAIVWERWGDHAGALDHAQHALALFTVAGHRRGEAHALNGIGMYYALLSDHRRALTYCQRALVLQHRLGDRYGQAYTWNSLGHIHRHLGHTAHAVTYYQHAVDLQRELGDRYSEATSLIHLGDTHYAAGDSDDARTAWKHALSILEDLDHPHANGVRSKVATLDAEL